jgi:hypothetical protein
MELCTETLCKSLWHWNKWLNVTVGFSKTVHPATLLVELCWWLSHLYKYLATTFARSNPVRFLFCGVTWMKEPIQIIPARWMTSRRQFRRQWMVSILQCWDACRGIWVVGWNCANRRTVDTFNTCYELHQCTICVQTCVYMSYSDT